MSSPQPMVLLGSGGNFKRWGLEGSLQVTLQERGDSYSLHLVILLPHHAAPHSAMICCIAADSKAIESIEHELKS